MKTIFLFLMIFPVVSFAQLEGKYFWNDAFTGECFEFLPDSCFKYSDWCCTGASYGSGHYSVRDTLLVFTFGSGVNNDFNIESASSHHAGDHHLDVYVSDKVGGNAFSDLSYVIQDSTGGILSKGKTDSAGHFKASSPRPINEASLTINFHGQEKGFCIRWDDDYVIRLKFQSYQRRMEIDDGEIFSYRFVIADANCVFLRSPYEDDLYFGIKKYTRSLKPAWQKVTIPSPDGALPDH